MPSAPLHRSLVLGIGNLLMGDEGIGVVAIRYLESAGFAACADLLDGGTGGFHLLSWLQSHPHVILIDAANDGNLPGTVSLTRPRFAKDFPPTLSAHDIGLKDLIETAALLGNLPVIDLVTISVAQFQTMTLALSEPVNAALARVEAVVTECLRRVAEESLTTLD